MVNFSVFKIGLSVTVVVESGFFKGQYPSRIEDIDEEKSLVALSHLMYKGSLLPIYRDMKVKIIITSEGGVFSVNAVVVRTDRRSVPPLIWIKPVGEVEKIQRRRFVRVSVLMDLSVFNLSYEDKYPLGGKWVDGKILDISLGGARISLPKGICDVEDRILVEFEFPDVDAKKSQKGGKPVVFFGRMFIAKVVRKIRSVDNGEEWGINFVGMPDICERKLQKFIFERERQIKQKNQG